MNASETIILPCALLFDMDGTLTAPVLDFDLIKEEMGIAGRPILESLAEMNSHARAAAEAILHRHEERAALESTLNPGCEQLLLWVRERNFPAALITRNSRASVERVFHRHELDFDVVITREDGLFKPSPQPLLEACRRLKVCAADAWMIGDGSYDVQAGVAAGMRTVWISHRRARAFEPAPWKTANDLPELLRMLDSACQR